MSRSHTLGMAVCMVAWMGWLCGWCDCVGGCVIVHTCIPPAPPTRSPFLSYHPPPHTPPPQANELLETATHDKHIAVALDVLSTYVRHYGAHIRDTCAQDVSALHHDMELEARRDTCMACRAALQGVLPQLSAAARAHEGGQLGRKAQELQDELACL